MFAPILGVDLSTDNSSGGMGKPVPERKGIVVVILMKRFFSVRHANIFGRLLGELRLLAVQQPGYITSQSLLDENCDEQFLAISTRETWESLEYWQAWFNHPDRQQLEFEVQRLQERPTCIQVVT